MPTEQYGLQDFKLERMRSLLHRLGDPQLALPVVHIAGTKGKGSTAAMIASMLQAAGHRVGLFTSPHVEHFSERMTVDAQRPSPRELMGLLDELRPVVEEMDRENESQRATFFEVLTAMAWLHFRNRKVDIVVLEAGLGGRLDSTNVCVPLLCVITSISRDHERLLGNTLAAIAGEKAGIIKSGVPVISGVIDEESAEVIRRKAESLGAPVWQLGADITWQTAGIPHPGSTEGDGLEGLTVNVQTPLASHSSLGVPLAGDHQADNLALAVTAIDQLNSSGWSVSDAAIADGLERVNWPLRVEVVQRHPLVIVDVAHNVASIAALSRVLAKVPAKKRVLVFGTARDKDTVGMLQQVAGEFDHIVLTQFVNNPRAVARAQLEELALGILDVPYEWADDPAMAWKLARQSAGPDSLICATGSFFLAAEFRTAVRTHGDAQ